MGNGSCLEGSACSSRFLAFATGEVLLGPRKSLFTGSFWKAWNAQGFLIGDVLELSLVIGEKVLGQNDPRLTPRANPKKGAN